MIIVVVINVLLVWLPIVLHLVAPGDRTPSHGLQRLAAYARQRVLAVRADRGRRDHGHRRHLRVRHRPRVSQAVSRASADRARLTRTG